LRKAIGAFILVAAIGAAIAVVPRTGSAAGAPATISFTAAQQAAGSKQFETTCSPCHGVNLEGGAGPALTGPPFKTLSSKVGADVSDIFTYLSTNMPLNAPASLTHDQYVNILAFILSKNGYKPGGKPLTFATASSSKAPIIANH
jgi:polar amino acid transport system substrate-binding protein